MVRHLGRLGYIQHGLDLGHHWQAKILAGGGQHIEEIEINSSCFEGRGACLEATAVQNHRPAFAHLAGVGSDLVHRRDTVGAGEDDVFRTAELRFAEPEDGAFRLDGEIRQVPALAIAAAGRGSGVCARWSLMMIGSVKS